MEEGETYNVSKKIVGEIADRIATNYADELAALKKEISTVQNNQKTHQEKDDKAFSIIEERGKKIDEAIPKISKVYEAICGDGMGNKGYNQRVGALELDVADLKKYKYMLIGIALLAGSDLGYNFYLNHSKPNPPLETNAAKK